MLILGWISEGITSVGIWLTGGVYHVAAYVFELFLILASGKLLEQASYEQIIKNFYLVLGIIMLFVLAFSLLRGMVNPDDQKKGATTIKKIIINIVTSAIIMAVLPTIFSFMYDFQDAFILEQNTIGKFFGYGTSSSSDNPVSETNLQKVQKGAYQIVNGVYTAFFNVNLDECKVSADNQYNKMIKCQENEDADKVKEVYDKYDKKEIDLITLSDTINYVNGHGSFGAYNAYAKNVDDGTIDFNFLMCLIGGALLVYVGISYCFDMAVRLVKLVFYQLIAPIPIFFRIIPEGKLSGTFNQWMKITLTCYMEVYVRIFIFYFCVYLCSEMIKPGTFLGEQVFNQYGILLGLLAKAFVLMGIVTFMKQAPKLISEITGLDSGNMKLGIKDKLAAGGAFTAGAILGGGATAFARNAVNGAQNIKNKWGETKGIKGKAGLIAGAIGSTVAGTASAQVRSFKAGSGAKSWGDMKKAAGSGAKGAVDARESRASYKAKHGGTLKGAMKGHIEDLGYDIARWGGYNNIDALVAENNLINDVQSQRKAIDNEARELILGDLTKMKGKSDYDTANFGMKRLEELKAQMDASKNGSLKTITNSEGTVLTNSHEVILEAERQYSQYLKGWQDELVDLSLYSNDDWNNNLSAKTRAELSKVRMASDKYRETLSRNITAPFVASLKGTTEAEQRDYQKAIDALVNGETLKHDNIMLDKIKDQMKIEQTKVTQKINEVRQKDQERKKDN